MPKMTIDDLNEIKKRAKKIIALREGKPTIKITVHMGACGIKAGARDVMRTLLEDVAQADRSDIFLFNSGCLGECDSEPSVTVEMINENPVIYRHMNQKKIHQVFKHHILLGEVQDQFM